VLSPGLRDEPEDTLRIGLFKSGVLGSEAFSRCMGARGLDNMLNCGPGKVCDLPDLAVDFPLPAKGANGSTNGSSLVLIRLVLLKNV
jgi:hypothetical protein